MGVTGRSRRQVLRAAWCALLPVPLLRASASVAQEFAPPAPRYQLRRTQYRFARGDRPLRTVVWCPVGAGRFPLVLFSHGLHGSPERFAQLITDIAGAGFVVAAPAYPFTTSQIPPYGAQDVPNQPADASAVISAVLAGELTDRVLADRIGAVGHSAGAFTTAGLLAHDSRDTRVRAAVLLAGAELNGTFTGPPTDVLFVHGDRDSIVPYALGRAAYRDVPWRKALLTVEGGDHETFMFDRSRASVTVTRVVLDFLRGSLGGDPAASARLPAEATVPGVAHLDQAG